MSAVLNKIENILTSEYSVGNYVELIREIFDSLRLVDPNNFRGEFSNFSTHIKGSAHIGNYTSPDKKRIAIFAVELKKENYVESSRSTQRSYAKKLIESGNCDAAIVAFYTAGEYKWRLSFVRLDYEMKIEKGKLKTTENITPAKRYSFLVGKDEPCHTAIERFRQFIIDHNSNPTLDELEEAFSVEKVTKEFFELYCEKFHQLREQLEAIEDFRIEAEQHNFTSAQFAKKLMGQIVFLYFLQKKGWLGVGAWPNTLTEKEYKNAFYARGAKSRELIPIVYRPVGDGTYKISGTGLNSISDADEEVLANCVKGKPWGSGPHDFMRKLFNIAVQRNVNFYNELLEPLFYDALNRNRGEQGYCPALHCRIPFLSGGLFEPIDGYDWEHNDFSIPNEVFSNVDTKGREADGILDIFDRYNFTMSEDEPMEREVAIDPEMLGKVFENLLEINDRKSKGAFYTPREIVHYMCQESLINYLTNALSISEDAIRDFILYGDFLKDEDTVKEKRQGNGGMYISEELYKINPDGTVAVNRLLDMDKALKDVRVADPAVGSGAFPLGMLNEIVRARQNISAYLAITMKPYDVRMMYQMERSPHSLKYETIRNCIFACDIEPSAVDIAQLRLWLALVIDDEINPNAQTPLDGHRNPLPLPNLESNILCGNSLVDEFEGTRLIKDSDLLGSRNYQRDFYSNRFDSIVMNLIETQDALFICDDPEKKKQLKDKIEGIRDVIIKSQLEGMADEKIQRYEETTRMASKPYVLWQLDFARVFREKGGFDIVIGNPPYFNVETFGAKSPVVDIIKRKYSDIWMDKSDILFYFIRLGGDLSVGQVCYITSNAYLFSDKGKKLRNYIVRSLPIDKIVNFENYMVFDSASITSCITFWKHAEQPSSEKCKCKANVLKDTAINVQEALYGAARFFDVELDVDSTFALVPSHIKELDRKIKGKHPTLGMLCKLGSGMQTAANKIYVNIPNGIDKRFIRKHLTGTDIKKYYIIEPTEEILYVEGVDEFESMPENIQTYLLENKDFLAKRADIKRRKRANWWGYAFPMHKEYYHLDKIWCSYRGTKNCFALDQTGEYIGFTNTTVIFDTNPDFNLKYLLALVNSKLMEYQHKVGSKQTGGGIYEYFPNTIDRYPIAVISREEQQKFIELIDKILEVKTVNPLADTSEIETKIDWLVYELYGLNEEEIALIENSL